MILEKGEVHLIPNLASVATEVPAEASASENVTEDLGEELGILAWLGEHFSSSLDDVLTRLEADGLLDDQRFAESYLRWRSRAGFGPVRIRSELKQRGVVIADQLLSTFDWFELAREVRRKKFGVEIMPNDLKAESEQIQFLRYRGFPIELILEILHNKNK